MTDETDKQGVPAAELKESDDELAGKADEAEGRWREKLGDVFNSIDGHEWSLELDDLPERRPLLELENSGEPWLDRGKAGMVAAPGGTGKTQALLQLAVSVASGTPFLDTFKVPEAAVGPVCVALSETDDRDIRRRLAHIVNHKGLDGDAMDRMRRNLYAVPLVGRSSILTQPTMPDWKRLEIQQRQNIPDTDLINALKRSVEGYTDFAGRFDSALDDAGEPWRLIVLDPLQRFGADDVETDQAAATRFVELLEKWARKQWADAETGPAVLVSHHTRKSADTHPLELVSRQGAARGASALTDGVRWQANMAWGEHTQHGETCEVVLLDVPKTNIGPRGDTVFMDRTTGGVLSKRGPLSRDAISPPGESDDGGDNDSNDSGGFTPNPGT